MAAARCSVHRAFRATSDVLVLADQLANNGHDSNSLTAFNHGLRQ